MQSYPKKRQQGVTIDQMAWLEGGWVETRDANRMEEFWSAPAAGTMLGMFRWINGNDLRFYEILALEEHGGGVVMRLKHFNRGFQPWEEEHMILDVTDLQGTRAAFFMNGTERDTWIVYERIDPENMHVWFQYESDRPEMGMEFRFKLIGSQ